MLNTLLSEPRNAGRRSKMIIFGWTIATLGVTGLVSSVILEIKMREPIYLLTAKISSGIIGIGGLIVGLSSLTL